MVIIGVITWFLRLQIDKRFKVRTLPFDIPITIFIMLGTVSVFMSPARNFELIYNYCGIVGIFALTYLLIGQNIRTHEQVKNLVTALAASAVIVVLYGYFQYVFGIEISEMKWIDGEAFPEMRKRIFSTFENPNVLAGYLDVMICLALGFLAKFGSTKQKLILVFAIILLTACLAMTYSRGAFLTIAAIFVIYGILYDWRVLILFTAITGILILNDSTFLEKVLSVFEMPYDSPEVLLTGIWVSTTAMIADHPFIGIGWGAYQFIYPQYNYYLANANHTIYHAHNLFLNTAAEVGIAGALAYFWYFFGTMFSALALNSNEHYAKVKNVADDMVKRASESTFQKKFHEELVKTFAESKFLQAIAQAKSTFILRLAEITHQFFDILSTPDEDKVKPPKKTSEPELVHHEEMKWNKDTKKADDKKTDDNNVDIQKFTENITKFDEYVTEADKQFLAGTKLGIGLAFLSMALNGLSDDLLFNIPSSILMWMLGALAAVINLLEGEK